MRDEVLVVNDRTKPVTEKWKHSARKLKAETYALYLAYKHPDTPWFAKIFAGLVIAYAFSPIDLVPDFVPVLGYLDDLILVPLGIALALKMIPDTVMAECRIQAQISIGEGKPINRLAAVVIVMIWLSLASLCIYWLIDLFR
jgi:uncharacterized membrane protein YkvA (DUF1232 family)